MAYNSNFTAYHTVLANFCTAGNTALSCDNCVLSDLYIVRYLYHVIKLNAVVYDGLAHRGSIDSAVAAYFNVIANYNNTLLGNFLKSTVCIFRLAESIAAYNCAGVDYHTLADLAAVVNRYIWVYQYIITYFRAGKNYSIRQNADTFTNFNLFADKYLRSDAYILSGYFCSIHYNSGFVNAYFLKLGLRREIIQQG